MSPDLPEGAAPFPGGDRGHATSLDSGRAATPGRIPWRPVGTGLISVGAPLGVALLHPLLGEVIAIIELAVMLTVLGTALFAVWEPDPQRASLPVVALAPEPA
jgi:hypothetical protein